MGKSTLKTLTPFGAIVREIRKEYDERGKAMARTLGVSHSYLSAIELGDRAVPRYFIKILKEEYNLDNKRVKELEKACDNSINHIMLKLDKCSTEAKLCAHRFYKKLNDLSNTQIQSIEQVLNKS